VTPWEHEPDEDQEEPLIENAEPCRACGYVWRWAARRSSVPFWRGQVKCPRCVLATSWNRQQPKQRGEA